MVDKRGFFYEKELRKRYNLHTPLKCGFFLHTRFEKLHTLKKCAIFYPHFCTPQKVYKKNKYSSKNMLIWLYLNYNLAFNFMFVYFY